MKIRAKLFNSILFVFAVVLVVGCKTGAKSRLKKKDSTLLLCFLESAPGLGDKTMPVEVGRTKKVNLVVASKPVITQNEVLNAEAWDTADGGVAIRLELDRIGRRQLEIFSVLHRGKRMAVQAHFPDARWIDVVPFDQRLSDGILILYPDASPEETDRIVKGLNLVAEAIEKDGDRDEE